MALKVNAETARAIVFGGAILGGGGGGWLEHGLEMASQALSAGLTTIANIDEVSTAENGLIATASMVGSPAAAERHLEPDDFTRAVQLLDQSLLATGGQHLVGLIASECGAVACVNGWYQAARLGLSLVDAPCDGRAHPTAQMGSLGLHSDPSFVSRQAAAGGDRAAGRYLELNVCSTLDRASAMIRQAAVQAGGLVAVARNPVSAAVVRKGGAPGALHQALAIGRAFLGGGADGAAARVAAVTGGRVVSRATVSAVELRSEGGFDLGLARLKAADGEQEVTFFNEYMTVDARMTVDSARREATFPDLIMLVDPTRGRPIISAEVAAGMTVDLLIVPRDRIILGAGVKDRRLLEDAGRISGVSL